MFLGSQVVTFTGCVAVIEAWRQSSRLKLARENDVVKLESIPIVRDFGR